MSDRDTAGRYVPGHNLPGPGRPTSYDPAIDEQARKLALLGLTDAEMAQFFEVCETTFNAWKSEHPTFRQALQDGKVLADAEVALSLYKRAVGQFVPDERLVKGKDGEHEVFTLKTWVPGDASAAKLWLTNRRGGIWRDKQSVDLTFNHEAALDALDGEGD